MLNELNTWQPAIISFLPYNFKNTDISLLDWSSWHQLRAICLPRCHFYSSPFRIWRCCSFPAVLCSVSIWPHLVKTTLCCHISLQQELKCIAVTVYISSLQIQTCKESQVKQSKYVQNVHTQTIIHILFLMGSTRLPSKVDGKLIELNPHLPGEQMFRWLKLTQAACTLNKMPL